MDDNVTFEVKKLVEEHSCIRSNKGGNRRATQGWIANVVSDKLKSDGDVSVTQLRKWLMKHYNVELPYQKVYRGKEQAYTDTYGKWEDSFMNIEHFKDEILNRNPGSIIDINFERNGDKKCFQRFFISLVACFMGFLTGCRPYISLDACHLKGKFNGVLVAATGIDGNSSMFPVAYGILESENTSSRIWFLELLKKVIGTPHGLVISSDMQKRLEGAAKTYSVNVHDRLLNDIAGVSEKAITYLHANHNKVLNLLDGIREMLMAHFDKKRRVARKWKGTLVPATKTYLKNISKNLGEYAVCRSSDNRAEVKHKGKRWEVVLE
ncbi:hypothetical protein Tco_0762681 [Tanacetum coccineum]